MTIDATQDKTTEEQENILQKSFSLFKTFAATGPQFLKDTLKDPRKQMAQIQDQLSDYGEDLLEKVPLDDWRHASKSDFQAIQTSLAALTKSVTALSKKVDAMDKTPTVKKPVSPRKAPAKKPTPKKNRYRWKKNDRKDEDIQVH